MAPSQSLTKAKKPKEEDDFDPDGSHNVAWVDPVEEPGDKPTTTTVALAPQQPQRRRRPRDKKTEARITNLERKRQKSSGAADQATEILQDTAPGYVQAETALERTTAVTQSALVRMLPTDEEETKRHRFDLQLPDSYHMSYDRSGNYALLSGRKGHIAMINLKELSTETEMHLQPQRVRDATYLHDHTMAAVAQSDGVVLYDNTGAQVHTLDLHHKDPVALQFLPYHWLLATACGSSHLSRLVYTDTSTGQLVAHWRGKMGKITTIRQNPANAVIHAGLANGCVSLWSPAHSRPLAKMLCHKGAAITDIAMYQEHTMVTAGMDGQVRIWDLRMYKEQYAYFTKGGLPHGLDISQTGLLAVGHGCHVTIWPSLNTGTKATSPYLHHLLGPAHDNLATPPVNAVRFCPFTDALGIGHASGVSSILVPGAGQATRDTAEITTDARQARESTVRSLLEKLPPELIGIDTAERVGGIEVGDNRSERLRQVQDEANEKSNAKKREKQKKRGRSKIQTKLRRKQNIIDEKSMKLQEEKAAADEKGQEAEEPREDPKETAPAALRRFFR